MTTTAEPQASQSADERGIDESAHAASPVDRFPKSVAMLLAALAIIGGMVAVLETYASTSEARAARATTRTAVEATATAVEVNTLAQLEAGLGAGSTDELDARAVTEADALRREAEYLSLKRAALTETRIGWNARASQLGTVVTVLGVAVFLTGFALVVHRRIRIPVVVPGACLGLACSAWAISIYTAGVPHADDRAIRLAAEGAIDLENGDLGSATDAFDTAVGLDSGYGPAWEGRAVAGFLAVNPDFLETGSVVDPSGSAVAAAGADLERAIALGDDHSLYAPTLLGVLHLFGDSPASAVEPIDDAIEINDHVPELWFARAAATLAAGDTDSADVAIAAAVELLDASEPGARTREIAAEFLTELEWIAATVPGRSDVAARYAREMVALESSFVAGRRLTPQRADLVSIDGVELALDGTRLSVTAHIAAVPDETVVTALVYERIHTGGAWAHAAEMALTTAVSDEVVLDETVDLQRACMPVELRMDVFVEGRLVLTKTAPGADPTC